MSYFTLLIPKEHIITAKIVSLVLFRMMNLCQAAGKVEFLDGFDILPLAELKNNSKQMRKIMKRSSNIDKALKKCF